LLCHSRSDSTLAVFGGEGVEIFLQFFRLCFADGDERVLVNLEPGIGCFCLRELDQEVDMSEFLSVGTDT
jgi:hypothetical protein